MFVEVTVCPVSLYVLVEMTVLTSVKNTVDVRVLTFSTTEEEVI